MVSFFNIISSYGMEGPDATYLLDDADPRLTSVTMLMISVDNRRVVCSGVYITPRTLLTATHCISLIKRSSKAVVEIRDLKFEATTNNYKSFAEDHIISNDLTVVKFDRDIYLGKLLHVSNSKIQDGDNLISVGYGRDKNNEYGKMQQMEFRNLKNYAQLSGEISILSYTLMQDGDSGGPLINLSTGEIVGINSMQSLGYNGPGMNKFFSFYRETDLEKLKSLLAY
jgi:V8-like Glu-specific endopeptidase